MCNELLSCAYERNAWYKRYQKQEDEHSTVEDAPIIVDCVTLVPNRDLNGVLKILLNDEVVIYDHSKESSADDYIDASKLRKLVIKTIKGDDDEKSIEMMSDDEAEEARKYFGVF